MSSWTVQEIYTTPYETMDWAAQRNNIAKVDLYTPHPFILDALFSCLSVYDQIVTPVLPVLRRKGMERAYELIVMDDENTSYQCLAPVNKPLNMLCRYIVEGPDSISHKLHKEKLRDFLWMGNEGLSAPALYF